MAKEGNSRFQLNKESDRQFDLSKGGKRKFDLHKESDEPEAVAAAPAAAPKPAAAAAPVAAVAPAQSGSGKKWLWALLGLVAVGAAVWAFMPSDDPVQAGETVVVEEVQEATEPAETEAPEAGAADDAAGQQTDEAAAQTSAVPATDAVSTPAAATEPSAAQSAAVSSDIEAEAMKVIRGAYGAGQERKDKLGAQYQTIQNRVNQLKQNGAF